MAVVKGRTTVPVTAPSTGFALNTEVADRHKVPMVKLWQAGPQRGIHGMSYITPDDARELGMALIDGAARAEERQGVKVLTVAA